jgi:hypothetical protein
LFVIFEAVKPTKMETNETNKAEERAARIAKMNEELPALRIHAEYAELQASIAESSMRQLHASMKLAEFAIQKQQVSDQKAAEASQEGGKDEAR